MKEYHLLVCFLAFIPGFLIGCRRDLLEITAAENLGDQIIATEKGTNILLIGAYSMLDGISSQGFGRESASSN